MAQKITTYHQYCGIAFTHLQGKSAIDYPDKLIDPRTQVSWDGLDEIYTNIGLTIPEYLKTERKKILVARNNCFYLIDSQGNETPDTPSLWEQISG